jgi:trimethylamine---corrinoid protein Co-methyltransferase
MFVNRMPRFEVLDADSLDVLDRGWRRILTEIGIDFGLPESVEAFRAAGQAVEGTVVRLDPEFVLEQVAKAPREFDVRARNEAHSLHVGGDHMVFASVYGPPFAREGDVRREATCDDFRRLVMLS